MADRFGKFNPNIEQFHNEIRKKRGKNLEKKVRMKLFIINHLNILRK